MKPCYILEWLELNEILLDKRNNQSAAQVKSQKDFYSAIIKNQPFTRFASKICNQLFHLYDQYLSLLLSTPVTRLFKKVGEDNPLLYFRIVSSTDIHSESNTINHFSTCPVSHLERLIQIKNKSDRNLLNYSTSLQSDYSR